MHHTYKTKGVCVTSITFDMDENSTVTNIQFENGCDGNLKILSLLLDGKKASEIESLCKGNTCETKSTSCADQLHLAVQAALGNTPKS